MADVHHNNESASRKTDEDIRETAEGKALGKEGGADRGMDASSVESAEAADEQGRSVRAGHTVVDTATGNEAPAEISEERVRQIFGTIARKYDRFNAASSFGLYKHWLNVAVDAANLTESSDLLDLAGGTGDVSYTAAKRTPPAHIQLTDFVPEMLEVAKERSEKGANRGVPVDFDVVDAQNIPYGDNSYDAITMAYGIRNIPDRKQALSEAYRVLKPGGTFACLEFSTPTNPIWKALYYVYLKVMIPFWGKLFTGDAKGFVYLSNSIRAFPAQKPFANMMEEAGFSDVTWKNLAGGIVAVHTGRKNA